MKRLVLGSLVAFAAQAAVAADLPSHKAPPPPAPLPPPPVMAWTGFYVGANVGGGWLDRYDRSGAGSTNAGVIGGGQVGYNYQLSPLFVVGVETDFQGSSVGSGTPAPFAVNRGVNWFGTARGRVGVSLFSPQLLFYGTGGFAYGEIELKQGGFLGALSQTGTGWTAGGGVEWAFLPNWSAKVEYLYTDIGSGNWGRFSPIEQRVHLHTARAGVNYHFDMFAPPVPVVAKY
jgi:outer membrane immunogenic protein